MKRDPFNVIVTGVGGQGNVVASRLIGAILVNKGFKVTIGETYGASQRGGSVMSHVRISERKQFGPLIPPHKADLVMALEPSEAARVLGQFGTGQTTSIVNTRPVYPVDVISGDMEYPPIEDLFRHIEQLSAKVYFVHATEHAIRLGSPILSNIILMGAVAGAGLLPIEEDDLAAVVAERMTPDRVDMNRMAFALGRELIT
jgi:indolepyruvate ferredoxin oxidoreductase beta subunit